MFGGIGKNFQYLRVSFFINLKVTSKNCARSPYFTLLPCNPHATCLFKNKLFSRISQNFTQILGTPIFQNTLQRLINNLTTLFNIFISLVFSLLSLYLRMTTRSKLTINLVFHLHNLQILPSKRKALTIEEQASCYV